ncbi:MAG: hypothetical protein L0958_01470 [Candidatus Mariimomonas ferrooxydans]
MKKKNRKIPKKKKKRPKNVWNSARKLEGYLKKADIQANIFIDTLYELRDAVSFEIKANIVQKLCNTVNGDILNALFDHQKQIETGRDNGNIKENTILLSVLDALVNILNLVPYRRVGERFTINGKSAKKYSFEEYPVSLKDDDNQNFEVEVLRCGWKVNDKITVKPVVFNVKPRIECLTG